MSIPRYPRNLRAARPRRATPFHSARDEQLTFCAIFGFLDTGLQATYQSCLQAFKSNLASWPYISGDPSKKRVVMISALAGASGILEAGL